MVDWQKKWFKRDLVRPSPLGLSPAAAGGTDSGTGALRGVPTASAASSSAIGATSTAAAPAAEVPEYIDA